MKNNIVGFLLMAAGIGLAVLGGLLGQYQGVLLKAANICLECIGIG